MSVRAVARPLTLNSSSQLHSLHIPSDQLLRQDISHINSVITSYVRRADPFSAWSLFSSLRRQRSDIDAHTFTPLLRPSPLLLVPQLGQHLHAQMVRTGADSGTVAKTALLNMYSRYGPLGESIKVFDEMGHRDVVAWNALLSCYLRWDLPGEVIGVLRAMGRENVEISEFTLCSVLKCCASLKALELGRQVHGLVVCMGRDLVVLSTALIDFYSSVGRVDDALKVFSSLKGWKDDMMHNSLVSGCIRNRRYAEAFEVMSLVKPNAVALTSVLVGCSENSDLWAGKQIHCVALRWGFTLDTQLCNALLDMYAKCGNISLARSLFDGICQKDVISWTCMIDAYGRHGHGHEAVELFRKMREDGSKVLPNSVTFLSVLSACDHSGLVEEGRECFNLMREKYGLEPDPEHYACFIDILGRAGNIEEVWSAYHNMIEQGSRPTVGVWIALLNACSLNQDVERGEFAAKNLLQLEPNKATNIVLASNYYAAIGRWDCVDELRSIIRTKGLAKEAGNSWINDVGFREDGSLHHVAVGSGDTSGGSTTPNDHYCWMRPEDMNYDRPVTECHSCSDLAAEMAAALAAASIVFKDNKAYSKKLVHGATTLFTFSRAQRGRYSAGNSEAATFYNSTGYWDEFVWGGAWMYFATGNNSYLKLATTPGLAKHAVAFYGGPDYGVLSWDNKLAGAQVLLSRLRLFLSPGYPYEEILSAFHNQTSIIMCSYLPFFTSFNRTKGGLIQLNHGRPQPLQYVVNAAFLATLYSDYLEAADTPGWYCGPNFFSTAKLREFARTQIDYILGKNPRKMSYIVGFGNHYPKHVHHRGASIPKNKVKYSCKGGWKWRDTSKPNPNTLVGTMVAGPDKHDGFHDVCMNYNYTEPTIAGNAGLVAALVALSGDKSIPIDKNTLFSAVPPMFPTPPPPPAPWKP